MKDGEAMDAAEHEASAWVTAAAMQLTRDELWRNPPPLADGCEHDLLCLLMIEARQTVICRKCGGLDVDASRRILAEAAVWVSDEDGLPVRQLESGQRVTYEVFKHDPGQRIQVTCDRYEGNQSGEG